MVSRRRPLCPESLPCELFHGAHSPLEKTPHKARNGELSITCRNRHCPKCQANAREKWLAARRRELLPITYSMSSSPFPTRWPRWSCRTRSSSTISCSSQRRNAARSRARSQAPRCRDRFLSVLHTWSQKLDSPHVHCVVPAGGLSLDHTRLGSPHARLLPSHNQCWGEFFAASSSPRSSTLSSTANWASMAT